MQVKPFLLAAATAALLATQSASAAPIIATYLGGAYLGNGSQVGYQSGTVSPGPNNAASANVLIGGDSFSATPAGSFGLPTGTFDAWCVDILHWLSTPTSEFNVSGGASLAATLSTVRPGAPDGTQRVTDLDRLADLYYGDLNTKDESAAFQLAVWAITYGSKGATGYEINTTDVNFHVDSVTANSNWGVMANTWLDGVASSMVATSNYNILYLEDASPGANKTQDMVVFVKSSASTTDVPEPGSLALVGVALAAAWFSLRRRQA